MAELALGAVRWPLFWWRVLGLGLLAALMLGGLGAMPLFDVDEGAFSEATREMLASGDYLHTTLNGVDRFDKPIGVYWLQALSVSLLGLSEAALRLPSALCTLAWCLAVHAFVRPRWGEACAWAAAGLLACSAGVLVIGRAATADALLNLLLTLAGLDLWRAVERDGARAPLRRAAAWVGLGLLVKGPVALLVPGAALLLWVASTGRWRLLLQLLGDVPAWACLLGLALPWYLYALERHGMAFVDGFLMRHNVSRFSTTLEGHGGNPAYYLLVLPLLWLPASPLLAGVLARWRLWWADPTCRYLLGWAAFVLLFFSFSGTQLPHYVLYGATPLAVLMARVFVAAGRGLRVALWCSLALWWALLAGSLWALPWWLPQVRDALYAAWLAQAPAVPSAALLLSGALLLCLFAAWATGRLPFEPASGAAALVLAALAVHTVAPWWGETLQGPVRRAAAVATTLGGPVVQWRVHLPSFAVYRGEPVPRRAPNVGELALTRADRLGPETPVQRLHAEGALLLVRRLPAPDSPVQETSP